MTYDVSLISKPIAMHADCSQMFMTVYDYGLRVNVHPLLSQALFKVLPFFINAIVV